MMVDGRETAVGGWTFAIEARLKMVEHQHLAVEQSFLDRFESVFGSTQSLKTYKHIVLDVECKPTYSSR
jgi:hypothetical protein